MYIHALLLDVLIHALLLLDVLFGGDRRPNVAQSDFARRAVPIRTNKVWLRCHVAFSLGMLRRTSYSDRVKAPRGMAGLEANECLVLLRHLHNPLPRLVLPFDAGALFLEDEVLKTLHRHIPDSRQHFSLPTFR